MKIDDGGMTMFLEFPMEETKAVIKAMKKALKKNDIEALKWAARRMVWLRKSSESCSGGDEFFPAIHFNKAWKKELKTDPPPASIARIIARIER
jgi:hypothetical protein